MSIKDSLALVYRPKKLSDIIGQPSVVQAFYNSFKNDSLHHAYILAGKYGTGKTSVARVVAATENCKKQGKDPCGKCSICEEIFTGKSNDVMEVDAGSAGKVDNIRSIHRSLFQNPIEYKTKYVILDEAHSLTGAAAEASLKMIEEPPPNVRFILCTTEPQAFKPTIHSRCIMWSFREVPWQDMKINLQKICDKENLHYEEKALEMISKASKGSVRNSLQHLQAVINYGGSNEITCKNIVEALRLVDDVLYFKLIESILDRDMPSSFTTVYSLFNDGKEAKLVMDGLYDYINSLVIYRTCKENSPIDFSDVDKKRFHHLNSKTKSGNVWWKMSEGLSKIAFEVDFGLNPVCCFNRFIVEMFVFVNNLSSGK